MDKILLGFGLGSSVIGLIVFLHLKRVKNRMRRFVLRFEEIMDKVD